MSEIRGVEAAQSAALSARSGRMTGGADLPRPKTIESLELRRGALAIGSAGFGRASGGLM